MIDMAAIMAAMPAAPAASAPAALPSFAETPSVDTIISGLNQTELISHADLAELAGRLVKRKSDHHQMIGRTISKLLRGEPYTTPTPGRRNGLLYMVAGEIVEAFPYADPTPIVELFRASITHMAEYDAPGSGNPAPTPEEFAGMLTRHQGPKQGKHATAEALITSVETAMGMRRLEAPRVVPVVAPPITGLAEHVAAPTWGDGPAVGPTIDQAAEQDGDPEMTGAKLAGLDHRSVIVLTDGAYYVRHPAGRVYPIRCASAEVLRCELQRLFVDRGGLGLVLIDEDGEMIKTDVLIRNYATPARVVCHDYGATQTEFSPLTRVLRSGFTMGRMNDFTVIEPELDERVEHWLRLISGGTDATLTELYDWIAATDQRYIRHPSAALAIVGAKGIGKTVFGRALAHTWGQSEAVAFDASVDRFNGVLVRSPIWLADERMPKDLDEATFRQIVQAEERDIELKGQERTSCRGCSRIIFAVNEIEDLHIPKTSGADGAKAVADRLAIFIARPEFETSRALLAIREIDPARERITIARHLRWIQSNIVPREQRFYGARIDRGAAIRHVLGSAVSQAPGVFDMLADYFEDPISWEREYHPSAPAELGRRYPIVCRVDRSAETPDEHRVFLCIPEFCARLGIPDREQWRVRNVLKPFGMSQTRLGFGPRGQQFRAYYVEIDMSLLEQAIRDVDVVPAMVEGTRARMQKLNLEC